MPPNPIPLFIADRNLMSSQLLAESLARDPRFVVAAVVPPPKILSLPSTNPAGVAVISAELDSGPAKGMHLARALRARNRDVAIVMLLESLEREKVIASFRSGAKGVFCRTEPVSELHTCIERVSQGRIWTGRAETEYLLEAIQSAPTCDGLGELNKMTRREAEVAELAAQGLNNKQIARRLVVSEHTVKNHLFRIFEKLNVANRIELLFLMVNGRDTHSGELALRLLSQDKAHEPAVLVMQGEVELSQRRACGLIGLYRGTCRYRPRRPGDGGLRMRLRELAEFRRRFGYRRLLVLLQREGWQINHKRLYRLYVEEKLSLRRKRSRKRSAVRHPLVQPTGSNQVWSMDFMMDALSSGRRFRTLNIVDDYTRVTRTAAPDPLG